MMIISNTVFLYKNTHHCLQLKINFESLLCIKSKNASLVFTLKNKGILPCILLEYSCFYFIIEFDLHIVCSSWCKDTRPMKSLIQHHRKPGPPEAFLLLQVHNPPSSFYYSAGMCSWFYLGNYPDRPLHNGHHVIHYDTFEKQCHMQLSNLSNHLRAQGSL